MISIATAAAEAASALWRFRVAWLVALPAVLVVTVPIVTVAKSPPPYHIDHVKPVFVAIAQDQQPNDRLVVYPGAWHAYRYYAALSGIPPERAVFGRCPRRSLREPLQQLDSLRGKPRVCVLFAHVVTQERRAMLLSYLDTIGVRRRSVTTPDPSVPASASVDAHLYDLSDPVRLRNAAWDTYPVPRADLPNVRTRCMLGLVPME